MTRFARDVDESGSLASAINDLYSVFAGYHLRPHVESCPHCVTDQDHARIHARPLRLLTAADLDRYATNAMTTWGDEDDFRHFLPRVLELAVRADPDWLSDIEVVLGKLAYANWLTWPKREQTTVSALLRLRWNIGLTQTPMDGGVALAPEEFDADSWLCGIAGTGVDIALYIADWQRQGATNTLGHVAEFLKMNPALLTQGKLGNAFWTLDNPQAVSCAEQMRAWLRACLDDADFQKQLAAWYGQ